MHERRNQNGDTDTAQIQRRLEAVREAAYAEFQPTARFLYERDGEKFIVTIDEAIEKCGAPMVGGSNFDVEQVLSPLRGFRQDYVAHARAYIAKKAVGK